MIGLLRRLFRRSAIRDDIREEIESHVAMRAERNRESGMAPEEAVRSARRQFGNATAVSETLYEGHGFGWLDHLARDAGYAIRGLRRNPGVSLTAIVTIAIGIGAVASMFGIMRNLLLAPPHVSEPDRVYRLHSLYAATSNAGPQPEPSATTAYPFYERLARLAASFEAVGAYDDLDVAAGAGPDARMTHAVMVSAGFWKALGVRPAIGRLMFDHEAHPATGARVVVLGHEFWRSAFAGRAEAVGRTLSIKGQPYQIIGVAPRGFRGVQLADVDLWLPFFAYDDGSGRPVTWHTFGASFNVKLVGRLKADVSPDRAAAEVTLLQRAFLVDTYRIAFRDEARLEPYRRMRALLGPVTGGLGDNLRPIPEARVSVWLVGIAVILVGIACLNVAGLLMLRAMRRRREIAVRLALGVSKRRLAGQLLVESSVLAFLGGGAALVAVLWGGTWLQRTILPAMAWEPGMLFDPGVLTVAGISMTIVALAAGLAPLVHARFDVATALHESTPGHTGSRPRRMHGVLLTIQGALSVVLLVGAGLFVRSLHNLETQDIGLDREEALAVQIDFSGSGRSGAAVAAFYDRALERVLQLPGVSGASLSLNVPLRVARGGGAIRLPGRDEAITGPRGSSPLVNYVTPDFFRTTGMRLLEGRTFHESERDGGQVIVMNQTMARLAWPTGSAIGQCVFRLPENSCTTVVGVVADALLFRLVDDQQPRPYYYSPLKRDDTGPRALLVRVQDNARMDTTLRRALQELEPGLPFVRIETLGASLDPQIRPWRLGATMFSVFGMLAMALAMIGLWSSVSYAVSNRTREFAVRLAVGASRRSVLRLVVGDGVIIGVAAIGAGLTIAMFASRFIADLLYEVSPRDPAVFGVIAVGVLAVAAGASLLPAWRACRIDPATSLRTD